MSEAYRESPCDCGMPFFECPKCALEMTRKPTDTERLDWLQAKQAVIDRDNYPGFTVYAYGEAEREWYCTSSATGSDLRAAIDAAMRGEP